MLAFDTGPGNVMIDHVMRVRCGVGYDKDGEVAARGTVLSDLLAQLQEDARGLFNRPPPRSASRLGLDFGSEYADRILQANEAAGAGALTEDLILWRLLPCSRLFLWRGRWWVEFKQGDS